MNAPTPQDSLPPKFGIDYRKTPVRSSRYMPQARAHETVIASPVREPKIGDLVARAKGDHGGDWLADKLREFSSRRLEAAVSRRNGENVRDHEAEALSFAAIKNLADLQRRLDFPVQVTDRDEEGNKRSLVTTNGFALVASNLATTDVMVAMESVPSVVDRLVTDIDDMQPNTEVPALADELVIDMPNAQRPKPLGEVEDFPEVGAGEERYTGLCWKSGFQRGFSQTMIDRGGPFVFSQLSDLGRAAMEVMEFHALRDVIDYDGSASSGSDYAMIRNRAGAALFSATANTPDTRAPNGTRIQNNSLVDITDIETLRARLATMRNFRGSPSPTPLRVILVPDALWLTAWTILNSQGTPGVFNETNFYGPMGPGGGIELLSTPFLDLYSTSAWYGGDPKLQIMRKWALRPEVAVHGGSGTLPFLKNREGFRVRIGWDMKVFHRDYTRWVENLPATTAPKDQ